MTEHSMTLPELLEMIEAENETPMLPVDVRARLVIKVINSVGDLSYLDSVPKEVRDRVSEYINDYKEDGKLTFISSDGVDDLSEQIELLLSLVSQK